MKINILGFLVLRKPEQNFDELGRGAFSPHVPRIDSIYYGGVDRMEWFDIDEDFFNKSLPKKITEIRENVQKYNGLGSDIRVCTSIEETKMLLDYSNKSENRNEMVAIFYKNVDRNMQFVVEINASYMGCDLYCEGYGSMIKEGIFSEPDSFETFIPQLNKNGLFESRGDLIERYIDEYHSVSQRKNIEKMLGLPIKKIEIYKIQMSSVHGDKMYR